MQFIFNVPRALQTLRVLPYLYVLAIPLHHCTSILQDSNYLLFICKDKVKHISLRYLSFSHG